MRTDSSLIEVSTAKWLYELAMNDPALMRCLESLSSPTAEQLDRFSSSSAEHLSMNSGHTSGQNVSHAVNATNLKQNNPTSSVPFEFHGKQCISGLTRKDKGQSPKLPRMTYMDRSSNKLSQVASLVPSHPLPTPRQESDPLVQPHQQQVPVLQNKEFTTSLLKLQDKTPAPQNTTVYKDVGAWTCANTEEITDADCSIEGRSTNNCGDASHLPSESRKRRPHSHCLDTKMFGSNGKLNSRHAPAIITESATPTKASGHTQDHIMAERKRREKQTQRFIALSAMVPGLKKTDKASILGDAIKYVKHLQERLRTIEEHVPLKSVPTSTNMEISACENAHRSLDETTNIGPAGDNHPLPDIEVRMVNKNVLIRVHCEKKKGLLLKSIVEIEKLQMVVNNASILSFTDSNFDMVFNAQVEAGCEVTVDDVVKALQELFKNLADVA